MKLPYNKPVFKPVLLSASGGSCELKEHYSWGVCPVDIGGGETVFSDGCDYEADDFGICAVGTYLGENNVYGS